MVVVVVVVADMMYRVLGIVGLSANGCGRRGDNGSVDALLLEAFVFVRKCWSDYRRRRRIDRKSSNIYT